MYTETRQEYLQFIESVQKCTNAHAQEYRTTERNTKPVSDVYCDNPELLHRILCWPIPDCRLYPHEISMLGTVQYTTLRTNNVFDPKFEWYSFESVDSQLALLLSLIRRGYVKEASDDEMLECIKTEEARTILRTKSIKGGSTKQSVFAALRANFEPRDIYSILGYRYYVLSAKAKDMQDSFNRQLENNGLCRWAEHESRIEDMQYLDECQIIKLYTNEYELYIDEQYRGTIVNAQTHFTTRMKTKMKWFKAQVHLTVFSSQNEPFEIKAVKQITILPKLNRLICLVSTDKPASFCSFNDAIGRYACYDLRTGDVLFEEECPIESIHYACNGMNGYEHQQMIAKMHNPMQDGYIEYVVSVHDILTEIVLLNYFARNGQTLKLPALLAEDTTTNISIRINEQHREDLLLLNMLVITGVVRVPMVKGVELYMVLWYFDVHSKYRVGKEHINNQSMEMPELMSVIRETKKAVSRDWRKVVAYFGTYMPAALLLYNPWPSYTSKDGTTYDPYYREAQGQIKQLQQRYREILVQLQCEGLIPVKWKNEFRLYMTVKELYPDTLFQYHAHWLAQQSLDIFIPSMNTGIEYQGEQHYRAIEIFGGEEGLAYTEERDRKKRELCKQHGIRLLEWSYTQRITKTAVKAFLRVPE